MKTPKQLLKTLGQNIALNLWSLFERLHNTGDITLWDRILWRLERIPDRLWELSYFGSDQEAFDVLDWGWDLSPEHAVRYLTDRQRFCLSISTSIH